MNVHMVALPAAAGGTMLVNIVDLVAITPDEEGSVLHLRYGGDFVVAWPPDQVADELARIAQLLAEERGS